MGLLARMAGTHGILVLVFLNESMLFSTVAVLIYLPSNRTCESFSLPTSPTLFLIFLNNGCANKLSVAVTHNNQCKRKRYLFWLIVSEVALDL